MRIQLWWMAKRLRKTDWNLLALFLKEHIRARSGMHTPPIEEFFKDSEDEEEQDPDFAVDLDLDLWINHSVYPTHWLVHCWMLCHKVGKLWNSCNHQLEWIIKKSRTSDWIIISYILKEFKHKFPKRKRRYQDTFIRIDLGAKEKLDYLTPPGSHPGLDLNEICLHRQRLDSTQRRIFASV